MGDIEYIQLHFRATQNELKLVYLILIICTYMIVTIYVVVTM